MGWPPKSLFHTWCRQRSGYIDNFGGSSHLVDRALFLTLGMVAYRCGRVHTPLMFCSYISEAAASLLDTRLNLHIVPMTQLVSLSSPVSLYELLPLLFFERECTTGVLL